MDERWYTRMWRGQNNPRRMQLAAGGFLAAAAVNLLLVFARSGYQRWTTLVVTAAFGFMGATAAATSAWRRRH